MNWGPSGATSANANDCASGGKAAADNNPPPTITIHHHRHVQRHSLRKESRCQNLYISDIAEEFIAMQVDLEIPLVVSILKELDVYKGR